MRETRQEWQWFALWLLGFAPILIVGGLHYAHLLTSGEGLAALLASGLCFATLNACRRRRRPQHGRVARPIRPLSLGGFLTLALLLLAEQGAILVAYFLWLRPNAV